MVELDSVIVTHDIESMPHIGQKHPSYLHGATVFRFFFPQDSVVIQTFLQNAEVEQQLCATRIPSDIRGSILFQSTGKDGDPVTVLSLIPVSFVLKGSKNVSGLTYEKSCP